MGNGFYWTSVKGYRGSYLTAYNNGDYGIYSYSATDGQFDNSRTITEETTIDMKPAPTTISPSITIGGPGLANPVLESIPGFYMYLLPLSLYVVWLSLATWDLVRRSDIKSGARIGWLAIVYLIPVLGPLAYYLFGRSGIPRGARLTIAFGIPLRSLPSPYYFYLLYLDTTKLFNLLPVRARVVSDNVCVA